MYCVKLLKCNHMMTLGFKELKPLHISVRKVGTNLRARQHSAGMTCPVPIETVLDNDANDVMQVISVVCVAVWAINIGHFNDPAHGGSWLKVRLYSIDLMLLLIIIINRLNN